MYVQVYQSLRQRQGRGTVAPRRSCQRAGYVPAPPVEESDHGLDGTRYLVAHVDLKRPAQQPATSQSIGRFGR